MRQGRPRKIIEITDKERVAGDIISKLKYEGRLSDEQLALLTQALDSKLAEYSVNKDVSTSSNANATNEEILNNFIAAKRVESRSHYTLYNYHNEVMKLFNVIDKHITQIDSNDIRRYMDFRKSHDNLKSSTVHNIRMYLLSFFKWCVAEDIIIKSPMDKIGVVKTEKKVVETLTDEEQEMIRCACTNERDIAIIDLLSSSGMRVSELCGLNIRDVDFDNNEVKVFGKGAKERICFFTGRCKVHLLWYLESREDSNPALFVTSKHPYDRLTKNGVEYILRTIAQNSKIDKIRLYPHKYRSTLATNMANKGASVDQIQHVLGHTNPDTTEIYIKTNKNSVKAVHNRFVM